MLPSLSSSPPGGPSDVRFVEKRARSNLFVYGYLRASIHDCVRLQGLLGRRFNADGAGQFDIDGGKRYGDQSLLDSVNGNGWRDQRLSGGARCSGANCSNFVEVGTSATTSFDDTGLAPSTSYSYEVRAADTSNDTGPYSTSAAATTSAGAVPTAPGNLTLTVVSATQINLSWTASTEMGSTISGYQIARCSGANCSNFALVGTSATTTFNNTGLTGAAGFSYEVRAVDPRNNTGPYSSTATATTLVAPVPTAPGNLTLTVVSATQINLSWTASTEAGGTISGYQIARCSGANCSNFAQVGTSATTTFNNTGLTGSTSYSYEVRAVDTSNDTGPYSTSAAAATLAAPVPTAPGNLTLTVVSATQINLSWTASTEAGGTISGYQIARCSGTNCSNFAQVGTSATTTFNNTGLTGSTSYSYEVRAVDASNNTGPYSTSATSATLAAVHGADEFGGHGRKQLADQSLLDGINGSGWHDHRLSDRTVLGDELFELYAGGDVSDYDLQQYGAGGFDELHLRSTRGRHFE